LETLRKNEEEMLEIKNTVTDRKNAFDGLISRLDTAEEESKEFVNRKVSQAEIDKKKTEEQNNKQ
jgi:hypothetical protein